MRAVAVMVFVAVAHTSPAVVLKVGGSSEQFATIQSAIDVAASGDTISIAPGIYSDSRLYSTDGWTSRVNILVTQEQLTIIGAGAQQTIVGPEEPWDYAENNRCIVAASWFGANRVEIRGLSIRNARTGINVEDLEEANIRECDFSGILHGINAAWGNASLVECSFMNSVASAIAVFSWYQDQFFVSGCEFSEEDGLGIGGIELAVQGSADVAVQRCHFFGSTIGLQLVASGDVEVSDCEFFEQEHMGLYLQPLNTTEQRIRDCRFSGQHYPLYIYNYAGNLRAERLVVDEVVRASIYALGALGRVEIVDSWFSKGSQGVFFSRDDHAFEPTEYSMPNNWWGTADEDSIAAWIQDASDNPEFDALVDFHPFMTSPPVPVEKKSLGDIKGLFR